MKLKMPIDYCLICFNKITAYTLSSLFQKQLICSKCQSQFVLKYRRICIDNISGLILYEYNDFFKTVLFRFKAAGDYALKDVFLSPFLPELTFHFCLYTLVPLPSNDEDNQARGFNHIEALIELLPLKKAPILKKSIYWKQSEKSKKDRSKINNYIKLTSSHIPKRICFVDDVITTGSTLKAALNLVKNKATVTFLILSAKEDFNL